MPAHQRDQLFVGALMRGETGITGLAHQPLLLGEMVTRVLEQLVEHPAERVATGAAAPRVVEAVDDLEQLAMLLINRVDPDTVIRVPRQQGAAPCLLARAALERAACDLLQARHIKQLDVPAVDLQQSLFAKAREQPADGLIGEPEVVADVNARHAEVVLVAREAALVEPVGDAQQKRRQAPVRAALGDLQDALVAGEFLAHDPQQLAHQARQATGQLLQPVERDFAYRAALERHRIAAVRAGADGIHPEQLARQMQPGDLLRAVFGKGEALEGTGLDRVDGVKRLAGAKQVLTGVDRPALLDDAVEQREIGLVDADRQAQLIERAILAGDPQGRKPDDCRRFRFDHDGDGDLSGSADSTSSPPPAAFARNARRRAAARPDRALATAPVALQCRGNTPAAGERPALRAQGWPARRAEPTGSQAGNQRGRAALHRHP